MSLTATQRATLKADAQNTPSLATAISLSDWPAIANYYNGLASPSFTVWRTLVPLNLVGMAIDFSVLAGLTTANTTRLQTIFQISPQGINAYLADRRAAFDDIFSVAAGVGTRAALLILWKRLATVAEKLFANTSGGNGADATPATLVFEGSVDALDVQLAFG